MESFRVMIVEDDFRVADINKSVTEDVDGYKVVKIAKTASEALSFIENELPDLIIVDIYLPDLNGMELIKKIRNYEYPVDFILITAAHDASTIENSMRYGVFDYIIKPFAFSRFKEALENYKKYRLTISNSGEYDQDKINRIISHNSAASGSAEMPKGITMFTLEKIEEAVSSCFTSFTIEEVIQKMKLSKITVRRYLEYMSESGLLIKTYEHKKAGRPVIIYTKKL